MTVTRTATAKKFLAKELEKLAADERSIVERFINRGRVARNVAEEFEEHLSFGQRIADSAERHGVDKTLGYLPVHPAEPRALVSSRLRRAYHNDEPEPSVRKRPDADKERLRNRYEGRVGNHAASREVQRP